MYIKQVSRVVNVKLGSPCYPTYTPHMQNLTTVSEHLTTVKLFIIYPHPPSGICLARCACESVQMPVRGHYTWVGPHPMQNHVHWVPVRKSSAGCSPPPPLPQPGGGWALYHRQSVLVLPGTGPRAVSCYHSDAWTIATWPAPLGRWHYVSAVFLSS
jgi:hypothetical protein